MPLSKILSNFMFTKYDHDFIAIKAMLTRLVRFSLDADIKFTRDHHHAENNIYILSFLFHN